MKEITEKKLDSYFEITDEAISVLEITLPRDSHLRASAEDFLKMINAYRKDAGHFKEKGDFVNSFAALNYLYGWIDAGVRLGILSGDKIKERSRLFTIED